jgi:DNA-directed RNA polymerase subunit beta
VKAKNGNTKSFAKLETPMEMPHLLNVQLQPFRDFLQHDVLPSKRESKGLQQVFEEVFPIKDAQDNYQLDFVEYRLGEPKFSVEECREKDMSYAAPLKAVLRLIIKETVDGTQKVKDILEKELYLGELPQITDVGTFVINGAERVIVNQLHRSPGVVFEETVHPNGQKLYSARIIPFKGSWVEMSLDINDVMSMYIDKRKKFPVTMLLRGLGYSRDEDIIALFYSKRVIRPVKFPELLRARPRDLANFILSGEEGSESAGGSVEKWRELTRDVVEEYIREKRKSMTVWTLDLKSDSQVLFRTLRRDQSTDEEDALVKIYNMMRTSEPPNIDTARMFLQRLFFNPKRYDLGKVGRYKLNERLGLNVPHNEVTLTKEDIIEITRYLLKLREGEGYTDDIDHLGNRRVRTVGELIANQLTVGLQRMTRLIKDRMSVLDPDKITLDDLVNARTVSAVINTFFGSSQLSQFMDQTNPLAELTHKRRLSALGPGGLTRERAGFEVRDVHYSHYGRMCPIETPEGPNIGLITSLTTYARINELGFIETPYRIVESGIVTDKIKYLSAGEEDKYAIAQANAPIDKQGRFLRNRVLCRRRGDFPLLPPKSIDFMDVAPEQLTSVAAALIPFLEHDDANRALMGSNMQRQAVPLLRPEIPLVATGLEEKVAIDSGAVVIAQRSGVVDSVSADKIVVKVDEKELGDASFQGFSGRDVYKLKKFERTNQDTCINQRPLVKMGDKVKSGMVIADGTSTDQGELALGVNVLVAFMPWYGYNFEDAIVISEKLVKADCFTSVHIQELDLQVRDTKRGVEEITREIPNVSEEVVANLDERGIIRVGAFVKSGDILVGKVSPKGETELSPEERLLKAIFGDKAGDVKDSSLKAPPGLEGVVIDVKVFSRTAEDSLVAEEKKRKTDEIKHHEKTEVERVLQARDELLREILQRQTAVSFVNKKTHRAIVSQGTRITKEVLDTIDFELVDLKRLHVANPDKNDMIKDILHRAECFIEEIRRKTANSIEKVKEHDELPPGVVQLVKVYIAQKRKVSVGDKMAGRHGNKGVVAKIVPEEDMPYMPDGTPVEVVLNPLGVPSRMNVGQILETHLGWAMKILGSRAVTPVFHGANEDEIKEYLKKAKLPENGKVTLYDGKSGAPFDYPVTVGYIYMLKLSHLVDDKIHARSIGPYSLVTQQPLAGKAQFGGQRFGEMEVWALEAYGAAHALQEMLTVKSDDVSGRSGVYEAIVKGENLPDPGLPESFNVLVKELQSLGLHVEHGKNK